MKHRIKGANKGRITLNHTMAVVIGTTESDVRYDMSSRNISSTDIFLDLDPPNKFPFTDANILEVWVELEPETTIFFNGKLALVVHTEDRIPEEKSPGVAVRIANIDARSESVLLDFIDRFKYSS